MTTDCERLSDRMPEVAMQRAAWTAQESAHLASCADCRGEWKLILAAKRLEARAPALDAAGIAAAVQRRLATERATSRRGRWIWAAGSAAAAAAALALALTSGGGPPRQPAAAVAIETEPLVPLPELDGLETAQLDTLLRAINTAPAGTSGAESTTLGDEVDAELEQILATWEG
jgi:hypothetical protein